MDKFKNTTKMKLNYLLAPHQKKVFYWQKPLKHVAYFLEMRLGKTRLAVVSIMHDKLCFPCLIICPYSAILGWKLELITCGFSEDDYIHLEGPRTRRLNSLESGIDSNKKFFITNREIHLSIGKELAAQNWGSVILDESHDIKNYSSKRSQYYTKNFRDVHRRIILSGTYITEDELDIFQQILFLDPDIFKETPNSYHFRNKYFIKTEYGYAATFKTKKFIADRLSKCCYIMTKKDAGLYTDKVYQQKVFKLHPKTFETYKNFVKNFVLEFNDKIYKVTEWQIAQYTSLRQLCSGFIKNSYDNSYHLIDNSKILLLLELLKYELSKSKVIIWCSFNHEIYTIHKELNKNKISNNYIHGKVDKKECDKRVKDFQNNKIRVLVCQVLSLEEGVTIDKADTSIYFSSPVRGKVRRQTEARMENSFVDEVDLIIDLIAENTLEYRIYKSHKRKENKQISMNNMIKFLQKQHTEFTKC